MLTLWKYCLKTHLRVTTECARFDTEVFDPAEGLKTFCFLEPGQRSPWTALEAMFMDFFLLLEFAKYSEDANEKTVYVSQIESIAQPVARPSVAPVRSAFANWKNA